MGVLKAQYWIGFDDVIWPDGVCSKRAVLMGRFSAQCVSAHSGESWLEDTASPGLFTSSPELMTWSWQVVQFQMWKMQMTLC